jgi:hypothetical protein
MNNIDTILDEPPMGVYNNEWLVENPYKIDYIL